MNKKPAPRPPFRYSFSLGVVVGVAFRIFAYVLLVIACSLPENRRFSPTASRVVELLYWGIALAALTSPFWVPFIAGFASVYFWGPLEEDDYKRAIWTSAISFFALSVIISRVVEILAFPCFLILFINLDVAMCGRGVGYGNRSGAAAYGANSTAISPLATTSKKTVPMFCKIETRRTP